MKKNGFTLIELIVCVTLLVLITGIITSLVIKENNSKKNLENITKEVLEAVNIFLETEKDEKGNTYNNGINNGGKALRIPLDILTDKGYVNKTKSEEIKKIAKLSNDSDYYILIADGDYNIESLNNETDYCKNNAQLIIASWTIQENKKQSPIYLCDYEGTTQSENSGENFIKTLLDAYGGESKITQLTDISHKIHPYYFAGTTDVLFSVIDIKVKNDYTGLFKNKDDNNYFYTGDVEDNYLTISDKFRIISFTDEIITLITEDNIDIGDYYNNYFNDKYEELFNNYNKIKEWTNSGGMENFFSEVSFETLCDKTNKNKSLNALIDTTKIYNIFDKPYGVESEIISGSKCTSEEMEKLQTLICPLINSDEYYKSIIYSYLSLWFGYYYAGYTTSKDWNVSVKEGQGYIPDIKLITYELSKNAGIYDFNKSKIPNGINGIDYYYFSDFIGGNDCSYYGVYRNYENEGWLSTGGSTLTLKNNNDNLYYTITNEKFEGISSDFSGNEKYLCESKGYLQYASIVEIIENFNKIKENLRPIIYLKTDGIKSFSGTGTKNNPYIVNFYYDY